MAKVITVVVNDKNVMVNGADKIFLFQQKLIPL